MRMRDDYEERSGISPTVVMTVVAVTLFVAALLVLILIVNSDNNGSSQSSEGVGQNFSVVISEPESEDVVQENPLRPEDLDFWDKYPPQETKEPAEEELPQEEAENDPATDGRHTKIVNADGSEEWVLISPYLPKHDYDFTKLVCQSDRMKYFENGNQSSFEGIDLSEIQNYVDFVEVKKTGIDFVMLRVGARGYGTGQLILDEYIVDNLKRATDAGLEVGVYFFSQAVSTEEAVEEANMVIETLGDYRISYPVAFDMEKITGDTSRTDTLSKSEKTQIAKAFLDTIEAAGYKAILYGDKEWLIRQIDMSKLTSYDIWLSQETDIPDYPYRFTMWQYNKSARVDGVSGYVNLNISFVDYSEK